MSNQAKNSPLLTTNVLITVGATAAVVWILIVATLNLGFALPCKYSPQACDQGRQAAIVTMATPLIVALGVLTLGLIRRIDINVVKLLITPVILLVLFWISWYAIGFLAIVFHGIPY